jgi:hypothetical protein
MSDIRFTEHLIQGGFQYAYGLAAADIAGNGKLDLVVADKILGLFWFENDGRGHFTPHTIYNADHSWVERIRGVKGDTYDLLGTSAVWCERNVVADLNGDGRPEIVIVDNMGGSVIWFECRGDPRDTASWTRHVIDEYGLPSAYDVDVADLDGDGDPDIVASCYRRGRQLVWYENRRGSWAKHVIDERMSETRTTVAVDVDGDGKIDVLASGYRNNLVLWYENPGDPATRPWKKHVIDVIYRPLHGHPVDMDGDGDVDLVIATGEMDADAGGMPSQIVWYENTGQPAQALWPKHMICESFPHAFEAVAADLDGDGQMEVVASSWADAGKIAIFKHSGDPRGPWQMQVLKSGWTRANSVIIADFDGDGRLDIAACAEEGANEVRWWHNEG